MKQEYYEKIHERLFAAVAGEIPFSMALQSVIDSFGGAAGVVFELDRKKGVFESWVGCGVEAGEQEYMDHINAINPRMRWSMRHSAGHVLFEDKLVDARSMDRSEFYNWLGQRDLRYFLGSRLNDVGDLSLFHSVEFTPRHGHPDADKIAAFKRMAPAIGNAWRASNLVGSRANGPDLSGWAPDHLPWAIFAFCRDGTVATMNASAQKLLASRNVLSINDGVVTALHRKSSTNLEQVLQRGLSGHSAETLLARTDAHPPLIAQIIPTNPARVPGPSPVVAVLYIWNPVSRSETFGSVLARLYGFTLAEARLAQALCGGVDLATAAEQLGVARNTARNQMQSMFFKTGTRRQNELLIRLWGVLETD